MVAFLVDRSSPSRLVVSTTGNYVYVLCDNPRKAAAGRCSFDDPGLSHYIGVVRWAPSTVFSGLISVLSLTFGSIPQVISSNCTLVRSGLHWTLYTFYFPGLAHSKTYHHSSYRIFVMWLTISAGMALATRQERYWFRPPEGGSVEKCLRCISYMC